MIPAGLKCLRFGASFTGFCQSKLCFCMRAQCEQGTLKACLFPDLYLPCSLSHNKATFFGGGLKVNKGGRVVLTNTSVMHNVAGVQSLGSGGGIYVDSRAALNLTNDTVVASNQATRYGGGVRLLTEHFDAVAVLGAAVGRHNHAFYKGTEDVSVAPFGVKLCNASVLHFIPGQHCQLYIQAQVYGPNSLPSVGAAASADIVASMDSSEGRREIGV